MKKIIKIAGGLLLIGALTTGCGNTNNSDKNVKETKTATITNTSSDIKTEDNSKYIASMENVFRKLYDRIDFDSKKKDEDRGANFLTSDEQDIKQVESIYNDTLLEYNKNKDSNKIEINKKYEQLLDGYKNVVEGRKLVFANQNDSKFMVSGYSKNVYTPIVNVKKLKDNIQAELSK